VGQHINVYIICKFCFHLASNNCKRRKWLLSQSFKQDCGHIHYGTNSKGVNLMFKIKMSIKNLGNRQEIGYEHKGTLQQGYNLLWIN
jgi:hypothetical protein